VTDYLMYLAGHSLSPEVKARTLTSSATMFLGYMEGT
jgi:hypothetical protein